jgi:gliding motility-associated transport system permease protein
MITFVLFVKELKSIFSSWIAYVVLIAFTLLNGITFYISLESFDKLTRWSDSLEEGVARQAWNLSENLIFPLYNSVFMLLFIMVPAITMRLFAEEKKQRTDELLLTSPIRVSEIIVAKYLAAVVLITIMLLPIVIFPGIAMHYGRPVADWGPMFTGYLGLFFLGYCLAAIGIFASSLTENQIVAFVFALAIEMLFFIMAQASITFDVLQIGPYSINLGNFLIALSITDHFSRMREGVIRLSDIFYFFSMIAFWLWASRQSVESTRWG